jgi:hypothetical protein
MVAHALDQLMSTVLEGSTKAVVAMKFFSFFLPTAPDTWPCLAPPRLPYMPATGPRADRGRANAVETVECIDLAAAGLSSSYLAAPGDLGGRI